MKPNTISTSPAVIAAALLTGCMTTMPGAMKATTSQLDGERRVQVEPGWIKTSAFGGDTKLGGFWSDKSPTNLNL